MQDINISKDEYEEFCKEEQKLIREETIENALSSLNLSSDELKVLYEKKKSFEDTKEVIIATGVLKHNMCNITCLGNYISLEEFKEIVSDADNCVPAGTKLVLINDGHCMFWRDEERVFVSYKLGNWAEKNLKDVKVVSNDYDLVSEAKSIGILKIK